jgi:hypothetical protein
VLGGVFKLTDNTEVEWSAAYRTMYLKLLSGALALEIASEQDRQDVEAIMDVQTLPKVLGPLRRTLAETIWHCAGREPALSVGASDPQIQHRARYAALYDFFFADQVRLEQ